MLCEVIMKDDVECVTPDDSVAQAAQRMRDHNVGFLPVCERSGNVVGTLTDRDIAVRVVARQLSPETRVQEAMSREVIACSAEDDIETAQQLMSRHRKSRIMCLDDHGRLEGIISLSDIAQLDGAYAAQALRQVSSREARL